MVRCPNGQAASWASVDYESIDGIAGAEMKLMDQIGLNVIDLERHETERTTSNEVQHLKWAREHIGARANAGFAHRKQLQILLAHNQINYERLNSMTIISSFVVVVVFVNCRWCKKTN